MNMDTNIEPPDSFHLLSAQGWLELGNLAEARVELSQVSSRFIEHPCVLEVRWQILAKEKAWEECVGLAAVLARAVPDNPVGWVHGSFALHELKQTREARDNLLVAVQRFPNDPLICYNLACYECQLGALDKEKTWFRLACHLGNAKHFRKLAREDPDLRPLWQRGEQ